MSHQKRWIWEGSIVKCSSKKLHRLFNRLQFSKHQSFITNPNLWVQVTQQEVILFRSHQRWKKEEFCQLKKCKRKQMNSREMSNIDLFMLKPFKTYKSTVKQVKILDSFKKELKESIIRIGRYLEWSKMLMLIYLKQRVIIFLDKV